MNESDAAWSLSITILFSSKTLMLTDHEIIQRVQRGERELFGELHTRHHDCIYRYVARSIWNREAAQDVACEVWLRAYGAVDRFEPRAGAGVLSWLLRIATNLITDYRRRLEPEHQSWDDEATLPSLRLLDAGGEVPSGAEVLEMHFVASPENEVLRRERVRAVQQALAQLSPGDRQIIYLAHENELSCQEIAIALDKPSVSAVTSHLHRAMNHLRQKLLESDWFGAEDTPNSPPLYGAARQEATSGSSQAVKRKPPLAHNAPAQQGRNAVERCPQSSTENRGDSHAAVAS